MIWLPVLSGVVSAVAVVAVSGLVAVPLRRAYGPSPWAVLYLVPGLMASTVVGDDTDWQEIGELVTESYRVLAPKKLTALLE